MRDNPEVLRSCPTPLAEAYDTAVLDLDGVVYVGGEAVPEAIPALVAARAAGMHLAYVTNNASRTPEQVAQHLAELGVPASGDDVVTSAQAAARLLADQLPAGASVFLIGGVGLEEALRERGLVPVTDLDPMPAAVAQGYGPEMPWRRVVDGSILVAAGLPWVASNTDATMPTVHGRGPGNGALVDLVARFAGREPQVAGKPQPPLFEETLLRVDGNRSLVVGDRADTDIEGARAVGWDSLLVMTGVTGPAELMRLPESQRPTYVAADLRALADPVLGPDEATPGQVGGWRAEVREGCLRIDGEGSEHDWWTAVASAAWHHLDSTGRAVEGADRLRPGSVVP